MAKIHTTEWTPQLLYGCPAAEEQFWVGLFTFPMIENMRLSQAVASRDRSLPLLLFWAEHPPQVDRDR
jgi:hypothetical protein